MAKLVVLGQCREAAVLCREVVGGNGIVVEHVVMRHFMDAEAQYSFEGTREINALIVGRRSRVSRRSRDEQATDP
ncbi:acyl-CoA dehydrogenase family protein [Arthrobacter sp. 2RAF6]|uniref:acyl-CoA dehydrogenase family protein n=1 Tax=Arthrobacter sp. 2RAF6 TaxID=3233002 RepID=UPI003F921ED7